MSMNVHIPAPGRRNRRDGAGVGGMVLHDDLQSEGGVEEEKYEGENVSSPASWRLRPGASDAAAAPPAGYYGIGGYYGASTGEESGAQQQQDDDRSFRSQLEAMAKVVFGSCGNAMEAASFFVQGEGCRWPSSAARRGGGAAGNPFGVPGSPAKESRPPLSIADELRKLALQDERFAPAPAPRHADIPRFLGEEAVFSFEDDDVSQLSQHTLEEMARRGLGLVHPMCRKSSHESDRTPPSPTRTMSNSSASSMERRAMEEQYRDPF